MENDLSNSSIDRQNILNNQYALSHAETHLALGGLSFEGETLFTKAQVAHLFDVDERTIERYLSNHVTELSHNGYRILKGKSLKNMRLAYVSDINVGDINVGDKTPSLGVFSFRAVLNLAMLLTESEKAKAIRSRVLDIVIDTLAERAGGHTKYINQRDIDYLPAKYQEFSYRKAFTDALDSYLEMGTQKYGIYTDKVYKLVFKENAREYKKILKLSEKDGPRETMYAEILQAITSVESGLAEEMKQRSAKLARKLAPSELDQIIADLDHNAYLKPLIDNARSKMASRDLAFREASHHQLEAYIQTVPTDDFERFLGATSQSLEERMSDPKILAVFQRLKDR